MARGKKTKPAMRVHILPPLSEEELRKINERQIKPWKYQYQHLDICPECRGDLERPGSVIYDPRSGWSEWVYCPRCDEKYKNRPSSERIAKVTKAMRRPIFGAVEAKV